MRDGSIHRDEKVLISESLHCSLATSPLFLTFCLIAFESQLDPLEWSWEKLKCALNQQGLELLLLNLEDRNLTSSVFLHNVELRKYCIVLPAVSVQCGFSYAGNNLETCLILCAVKLEYLSFQFILAGSHYFPICSKIK